MPHTILFADNNGEAREKWGKILQNAGYTVRLASTTQQAQAALGSGGIDLAVIDMRLEQDDLETDISGLELAANRAFRHIPKIILTAYPMNYEDQRKVWQVVGGKPPAVVASVGKTEKPKLLLGEIDYAFEIWPHLSMLSSKVSEQIKADHHAIRTQALCNFALSTSIAVFGFIIIIAGVTLAWMDKVLVGVIGSVTGLILQAIGYLFFARLDLANHRMDVYHKELLQTYWLEFLVSTAKRLPTDRENVCVERAIQAATDSWYRTDQKALRTESADLVIVARGESEQGLVSQPNCKQE